MKSIKLLLATMMVLTLTACGVNNGVQEPPVEQPEVVEPVEPVPPTYEEVMESIEVSTSNLSLLSTVAMQMWRNDVNVTINGREDIGSLVVRVYYYGNNKNVLSDSYDESFRFIELECAGQSDVYEVVGFYNPNVTRARAVVYRIVMTDGTVLETDIEL